MENKKHNAVFYSQEIAREACLNYLNNIFQTAEDEWDKKDHEENFEKNNRRSKNSRARYINLVGSAKDSDTDLNDFILKCMGVGFHDFSDHTIDSINKQVIFTFYQNDDPSPYDEYIRFKENPNFICCERICNDPPDCLKHMKYFMGFPVGMEEEITKKIQFSKRLWNLVERQGERYNYNATAILPPRDSRYKEINRIKSEFYK